MADEMKDKAIQTRIRAEIACEFADKCEKAGFTQKEVLNRMIQLFNQLGTGLFSQLSVEQQVSVIMQEEPYPAVELQAEIAVNETAAAKEDNQPDANVSETGSTDQKWYLVNPFGFEFRLRSVL